MRFIRLLAVVVVLLMCGVLGSACAGPRGEQGPQGEAGLPGAGITWQGEWSSSTTYNQDDAVGYQGSSYISNQDGNSSHLPTDTTWWDLWVAKGDAGATGAQGVKGDTGAQGLQGTQGIQGVQGDPGPNMIVAMGVVDIDGNLVSGYNVTSSVWNDAGAMDYYEITLKVTYTTEYVTVVTPFWNTLPYHAYGASGGKLVVAMYEYSNWVKCGFSFMVLECP
ncbi:MAG: collagen-like protein [Dehalococcoidia bacterium]|nr:collagen-like protein [Dehalococcoidia bacterium]